MISGDKKGQVAVWDFQAVQERTVHSINHALTNTIRCMRAGDGMGACSASSDGTVKLFDLETVRGFRAHGFDRRCTGPGFWTWAPALLCLFGSRVLGLRVWARALPPPTEPSNSDLETVRGFGIQGCDRRCTGLGFMAWAPDSLSPTAPSGSSISSEGPSALNDTSQSSIFRV